MQHEDHKRLIQKGIPQGKSIWAEFGSGEGAFTLALRDLAGEQIEIYSVDKNIQSLEKQKKKMDEMFPKTNLHTIQADFTQRIDLPKLDGILATNSLHFIKNKLPVLKLWRSYLKDQGKLIIVEYNTDEGNPWVPYPFSFESFINLAKKTGFQHIKKLESTPSSFLDEMYSAVAF